jgi:hypothetical protein
VILVVMRQSRDGYVLAVIAVKQLKGICDSVGTAASRVADNICQNLRVLGNSDSWRAC